MGRIIAIVVVVLLGGYWLFGNPDAVFRSSDGEWADSEYQSKGRTFEVIVWNFELYKLRCAAPNAVLVRATPQLWFNVFALPSYYANAKWRVAYSNEHSELGDYYPPASANNCYNAGSSPESMKTADENAAKYLATLK